MPLSSRVGEILQSMTLQEKVGQIFVFTWINEQQAVNDLRFYPGGYIRIYSDALSVARQSSNIQALSRIPLIIAADLERGIGGTICGALETVTCMALGASGDEQAAYDTAHMIGKEAAAMGINMNYAPCLDVNSNPANPVINTRSFGGDPQVVARLGVAFSKGLQAAGLASCGKHFPGHGDSSVDSHSHLGSVDGSRERLDNVELVPFKAAIAADVDSIMSAHLRLPAVEPEDLPATLSNNVMTRLLREELGFEGVAVSDALDMGAVANNYPPAVAIPMAINAGCDQLIMPQDNEAAYRILLNAVESGSVSEERLNEAVGRIISLKEQRGILDYQAPQQKAVVNVYLPEHIKRAQEIAAACMTLVSNDGILPLNKDQKIFCLQFDNGGDSRSHLLEPQSFADFLAADSWEVKKANIGKADADVQTLPDEMLAAAGASDVIILAAFVNVRLQSGTVALPQEAVDQLSRLLQLEKPVILASFGSPYIGTQFNGVSAYTCAYGATQPSQEAMAAAIRGQISFRGKLPVSISQ